MSSDRLSSLLPSVRETLAQGDFPEYAPPSWLAPLNAGTQPTPQSQKDAWLSQTQTHPLTRLSQPPTGPFDPHLLRVFTSSASFPRLTEMYYEELLALSDHDLLTVFLQSSEALPWLREVFTTHEVKSVRLHAWFFLSPVLLRLWHAAHDLDLEGCASVALESQRDVQQRKEELCECITEIYVFASKVATGEKSVSSYLPAHITQPALTTTNTTASGSSNANNNNNAASNANNAKKDALSACKPAELLEDNLFTTNLFLSPLIHLLSLFTRTHTRLDSFCDALLGVYGSFTERAQSKERLATHYSTVSLAPLAQSVLNVLLADPSLLLARCTSTHLTACTHNLYLPLYSQCLFLLCQKMQQHRASLLSSSLSTGLAETFSHTSLTVSLGSLTLALPQREKQLFLSSSEDASSSFNVETLTEKSRNADFPVNVSQRVCEWVLCVLRVRLCESESVEEKEAMLRDLLVFIQFDVLEDLREQLSEAILSETLFLCEHYADLAHVLTHTLEELLCWAFIALRHVTFSSHTHTDTPTHTERTTAVFLRTLSLLKSLFESNQTHTATLTRLLTEWSASLIDASLSICGYAKGDTPTETLLQSVLRESRERDLLSVRRPHAFTAHTLHALTQSLAAVQLEARRILEGHDCLSLDKTEKEGVPAYLLGLVQSGEAVERFLPSTSLHDTPGQSLSPHSDLLTAESESERESECVRDDTLRERLRCVLSQRVLCGGDERISLTQGWAIERESVRCVERFRYLHVARSPSETERLLSHTMYEGEKVYESDRVKRVWTEDYLSLLYVLCVLYEERLAVANSFARCMAWKEMHCASSAVLGTFQSLLDDLLKSPANEEHSYQTSTSSSTDVLTLLLSHTHALPLLSQSFHAVRRHTALSVHTLFVTLTQQADSDLLTNTNIRGFLVLVVKYYVPYLLSCRGDSNLTVDEKERVTVCERYDELLKQSVHAVLGYVRTRLSLSVENRVQKERITAGAAAGVWGETPSHTQSNNSHVSLADAPSSAERERELCDCLSLALSLFLTLTAGRYHSKHDENHSKCIIVPNSILQETLASYSNVCGEWERECVLCEAEEAFAHTLILSQTQRALTYSFSVRTALHTLIRTVRHAIHAHNTLLAPSSPIQQTSSSQPSHTTTFDLLSDDSLTSTQTHTQGLKGLSLIPQRECDVSQWVQHLLLTQRAHTTSLPVCMSMSAEIERVCVRLSAMVREWTPQHTNTPLNTHASTSDNESLIDMDASLTHTQTQAPDVWATLTTEPAQASQDVLTQTHLTSLTLSQSLRKRERMLDEELSRWLSTHHTALFTPVDSRTHNTVSHTQCVVDCTAIALDVLYHRLNYSVNHFPFMRRKLICESNERHTDTATLTHSDWQSLWLDYKEHEFVQLSGPGDVLSVQAVVSARRVTSREGCVELTVRVRVYNASACKIPVFVLTVLPHTTLSNNVSLSERLSPQSVSVEYLAPNALTERVFTFPLSPLSNTQSQPHSLTHPHMHTHALLSALSLSLCVRLEYPDLTREDHNTLCTRPPDLSNNGISTPYAAVGKVPHFPAYLTGTLNRVSTSAQTRVCVVDSHPLAVPVSLFLVPYAHGALSAMSAWREVESVGCVDTQRAMCESDSVCESVNVRPLMSWGVFLSQHARLSHTHPHCVFSVSVRSSLWPSHNNGELGASLSAIILRCVEFSSHTAYGGVGAFTLARDALTWREIVCESDVLGASVGWALQTLWQHEVSVCFLPHTLTEKRVAQTHILNETHTQSHEDVCGELCIRCDSEEVLMAIERDCERFVAAISGGFFEAVCA